MLSITSGNFHFLPLHCLYHIHNLLIWPIPTYSSGFVLGVTSSRSLPWPYKSGLCSLPCGSRVSWTPLAHHACNYVVTNDSHEAPFHSKLFEVRDHLCSVHFCIPSVYLAQCLKTQRSCVIKFCWINEWWWIFNSSQTCSQSSTNLSSSQVSKFPNTCAIGFLQFSLNRLYVLKWEFNLSHIYNAKKQKLLFHKDAWQRRRPLRERGRLFHQYPFNTGSHTHLLGWVFAWTLRYGIS